MNIKNHIPNILTLINLLIGCIAIVYIFYDNIVFRAYSASGGEYSFIIDFSGFPEQMKIRDIYYGKLHIAAILVFVAAIFDFFDGFAARLLNAKSEIGKQLDSLADLVNFGVVPGLIAFQLLKMSYLLSPFAFSYYNVLFFGAFALPIFAALRLARFNIDDRQTENFIGLPTPAAAVFVAALPLIAFVDASGYSSIILNSITIYIIIALLSYLMVSNLPIISLKISRRDDPKNKARFGILGMAAVLLSVGAIFNMFFLMIPVIIILYILISLIVNYRKNELHS